VAALCPTLTRPFGQNKRKGAYDNLIRENHPYYITIVIHSADHFLVDQFAVILQKAKRLGTDNLFVSMLDHDSNDSAETLTDLCEAVLTLLGVPFRIRRVPGMTQDPTAAYYPLEEVHLKPSFGAAATKEKHQICSRHLAEKLHLPQRYPQNYQDQFCERSCDGLGRTYRVLHLLRPVRIMLFKRISFNLLTCIYVAGERAISKVINSDNQNLPPSQTAVPPRDKQGAIRYA
jgi:hypothetical protein